MLSRVGFVLHFTANHIPAATTRAAVLLAGTFNFQDKNAILLVAVNLQRPPLRTGPQATGKGDSEMNSAKT